MRITSLGPPVKSSRDWDAWYHGCTRAAYPDLLLNKKSGWIVCKSCGYKRKIDDPSLLRRRPITWESDATGVDFKAIESGSVHERFLMSRMKGQIVGDWGVHPKHLNYATALVIERGEVVYWHARVIPTRFFGPPIQTAMTGSTRPASSARKWLSPDEDRGRHVYNLDKVEPGKPVFVCEGVFDALWFWPLGVAVMGAKSTEAQKVRILDRGPSAVYLCPDSDVASHAVAEDVAEWHRLSRVTDVISMRPKQGFKDWGEMLQTAGPKGLTIKHHGSHDAGNRS